MLTHYKTVNRTPAVPMLLEGWYMLDTSGYCDGAVMVAWDDQAITYTLDGQIVGVMSFNHLEWMKQIFVKVGYVHPAHRRRGIYKAMFAKLVEVARELGVIDIAGGRHATNDVKMLVDEKMGRRDQFVHSIFPVLPLQVEQP